MQSQIYEGVAKTYEQALERATAKIPPRPHRDFVVSKIVNSGMQKGGFANETLFYVQVIEDESAAFKTEGP